jgi:RNA polymerase sigma-70 factor (ECF subfamily)
MTHPLTTAQRAAAASSAQDAAFKAQLIAQMQHLRAFAISLAGSVDRGDDLMQETMLKAWAARSSFAQGTNLRAWLFTILRNNFMTEHRKRRREVEDPEGTIAGALAVEAGQESHVALEDLRSALARLPDEQREAVLLVGGSGASYEEAADIAGVAVGTIKSRVNRARRRLGELMEPRALRT